MVVCKAMKLINQRKINLLIEKENFMDEASQ